MEQNLTLLLCDIQSNLYEVLEFMGDKLLIGSNVNLRDIIKKVNQMASMVKSSHENISECIDLLSIDGIGSKSIVRSILIKVEVDMINKNQPQTYYNACLSGEN